MKDVAKKLIITRESIFFIAYTLLIFSSMFSNVTTIAPFQSFVKDFSFLLLLLSFIMQSNGFKKKQLFIITLVLLVLFAIYFYSSDDTFLILFLLIISLQNIRFDKFLKYDLTIRIIFFLAVLLCYKLGFTTNYYMYRIDGTIRSSMGFAHPNNFGMYIYTICADYLFLKFNSFKLKDYLIMIFLSFVILILSNSRSSEIGILIMIGLVLISKITGDKVYKRKWFVNFVKLLPIVFILLTIVSIKNYSNGNEFFHNINTILSNRIYYWNYFLKNYNITFFGNQISYISTYQASLNTSLQASVLDNSFLYLLINYGLCGFLIFWFMIIKILECARKENKVSIIIITITCLIIGFFESTVFKYQFNIFILYFCIYLQQKGCEKQ